MILCYQTIALTWNCTTRQCWSILPCNHTITLSQCWANVLLCKHDSFLTCYYDILLLQHYVPTIKNYCTNPPLCYYPALLLFTFRKHLSNFVLSSLAGQIADHNERSTISFLVIKYFVIELNNRLDFVIVIMILCNYIIM